MKSKQFISDWSDWIILFFLGIVWGTSFILIKKSLIAFDNIQVAGLRILISSLAFLPIVLYDWNRINWKKWDKLLIIGILGNGIPPFLFASAQTKLSSSLAGVLNAMTTIFTLLVAILFFKRKWNFYHLIGVLIGFGGAMMIILYNNKLEGNFYYALLVIAATMFYAFGGNIVNARLGDVKPLHISAVSLFFLMPVGLIAVGTSDFFEVMNTNPDAWSSLTAAFVLAIVNTVISSVLFYRLIQQTSAVFASTTTYLIPVFAVFMGVLDGESFYPIYFVSLVLIMIGVYLTKK
ncbi:MAG TPA: EamA family transporter [Saprospirales bacterium]|nr:EamA family transporter [Saprospirales bacterium]HAY70844.1 EamA family transporter [Saprospirales bacterium]HRQ30313.1 EamA family transporter [Saprospiraceae bacterium]